jgi:hypothetical protein
MVVRGRVQNGVVVLSDGACLPEGEEVVVLTNANTTARSDAPPAQAKAHSVSDIPAVRLGAIVCPVPADNDLLGEMLEGRS